MCCSSATSSPLCSKARSRVELRVVAVQGLRNEGRLLGAANLDIELDGQLHAVAELLLGGDVGVQADRGPDRHRGGQAESVQPVVDRHADASDLEDLRPQWNDECE